MILREPLSWFWCGGGGGFFDADGFGPFANERVALVHGHSGVGREHLRPFAAAPGEEAEEVFFAEVLGAGRGVDTSLATSDQAVQVVHNAPCRQQYAGSSPRFSTGHSLLP